MSQQIDQQIEMKRKTVRDIAAAKGGVPLVMLTAYTAPVARLADTHADIILVGDSVGTTIYGFQTTLPVTLEMMIAHGAAVVRASRAAHIVIDLPFGSYQEGPAQGFRSAARLLKETGCQSVKLEGGVAMAETVAFLQARGIPVIGHVGLQAQSVNSLGGYRVTGREAAEAQAITADAQAIADAGAFAIVLECVDEALAAAITKRISVPTIGIGASAACDGQVLVCDDLLGLNPGKLPKFVKTYGAIGTEIDAAFGRYAAEVRAREFPGMAHVYATPAHKIRAVD